MEIIYKEMLIYYLNMKRDLKKIYEYEQKLPHSADKINFYNDLKDLMKKTCKFFDIVTEVSTSRKYEGRILFYLATKSLQHSTKISELMRFLTKGSRRKQREKSDKATDNALEELENKGLIIQDRISKSRVISLNFERFPELNLFNEIVSKSYQEKDKLHEVETGTVEESEGVKGIKRAINARIEEIIENENYEQSLIEIKGFIKSYPDNVDLYIYKSRILCDYLKQYDKALDAVGVGLGINDKEVYLYSNKATILFNMGKLDKAIEILDIAIDLDGTDESLFFKKSYWLTEKGSLFRALIEIKKAIQNNPKYLMALEFKINLLERLESYEAAILEYDKVMELDSNNDGHYVEKSRILCDNIKDYNLALDAVEEGLKINQNNPLLFINKAMILNNMGDVEAAIENIDKALAIEENAMFFSKKAYLLQGKGEYEEALKLIKLASEKNFDENYTLYIDILIDLQKYDLALQVTNRAIEKIPDDEYLYGTKARLLGYFEKYEEALESINHARSLNSKDYTFYQIKAETMEFLGKYKDALESIQKAILLGPSDPNSYCIQAEILNQLGNNEEAINSVNKSIELSSDDDYFFELKAEYLRRQGDNDNALINIEKSISLNSKKAESHQIKALIEIELEKFSNALKSIEKAIDLDPQIVIFYEIKADILRYLNKEQKALDIINYALELDIDSPYSYIIKADILHKLDEFRPALDNINTAINKLKTPSKKLYNNDFYASVSNQIKADILYDLKDYENALEFINTALEYDFSNPYYRISKALIIARLGKHNDALETIKDIINEEPENSIYHFNYGKLLMILKKHVEAIEEFKESINLLSEKDPIYDIYIYLGECYKILGQFSEAKEFLIKGKEVAEKQNKDKWSKKASDLLLEIN